ncbi:MAG: DUF1080 domain-containing protein [Tepidisphaerales bacterium]
MRNTLKSAAFGLFLLSSSWTYAAPPGGPVFYGDAPDEIHPWAVHDRNRPQPAVVVPGTFSSPDQPGKPPSDAIILFDGTPESLAKWEADKNVPEPTKWVVKNGAMECVPGSGYIRTKDKFADCQLHVEWAAPAKVQGDSQGRGNSGVFMMGLVEIQVLDNYNNPTYADGFAAAVYGVNPPEVNPLRPPGEFQTYDIVFRRPVYKDGKVVDPGHVTVFLNGVLVQDHTQLEGNTGHMGRSRPGQFPVAGPLKLQDHGNPVRYRNIWYRPLPPRAVEGGTDGPLTPEAATAKKKEIAASIRTDAVTLKDAKNPLPEMLRLAESLIYDKDEATQTQVTALAEQYLVGIKAVPADKLQDKKNEVKQVADAFKYLARWKIIDAAYAPKAEIDKMVKDQGWDKK